MCRAQFYGNPKFMWDFIVKNKEWIFSGVGATILGVILSVFSSKKKKARKSNKTQQSFEGNTFDGSILTNFQGQNINYNQNIFQSNTVDEQQTAEEIEIPIQAEDLAKTKEDYIFQKANLRKFIYRVIAPAKNVNNIIQIRHVVDEAEDKLNISYKVILEELNEMESEGLITFSFEKPQDKGSPYNEIKLTKKFFKTIRK
jgi:hypothetical protein